MTVRRYLLPSVDALETLAGVRLERTVEHAGDVVIYDTFDGLLWAAGVVLMHALGELSVAGSDLRSGAAVAPTAIRADDLGDGPLRERIAPLLGVRAAIVQVRITGTATQYKVLDDLDKTIARVEVRDGSVAGRPLGLRAHVWALRGYEAETAELFAAFEPCQRTLYEEAMGLLGRPVGGISPKVAVPLADWERADAAISRVLAALWEVIDANLAGTLDDTDSEFLHDYRVAIRKTRAVLKEFKGVFTQADLAFWGGEFRWLQQSTGPSRDLDVYLEDFPALAELVPVGDRAALAPLRAVLAQRRLTARREMVWELRSERVTALARAWPGFLATLGAQPVAERPDARTKIDALASAQIAKRYRKMLKMGGAIGADSDPEEYHDLRKQGKELRYLLELFGEPLHDSTVVKPMIKALKGLQDVLGRHQDREVQAEGIRGLAEAVVAHPGGPGALLAMGSLAGALESDAIAARGHFAEAFASFSSDEQRRLVKETFGP